MGSCRRLAVGTVISRPGLRRSPPRLRLGRLSSGRILPPFNSPSTSGPLQASRVSTVIQVQVLGLLDPHREQFHRGSSDRRRVTVASMADTSTAGPNAGTGEHRWSHSCGDCASGSRAGPALPQADQPVVRSRRVSPSSVELAYPLELPASAASRPIPAVGHCDN